MSGVSVDWQAPRIAVSDGRHYPVRHVWCVGRNYAEHAREMGVNPATSRPVFFSKPAQAVVNIESLRYPGETESLHHEVELVACLGSGGRDLTPDECETIVFGYAVGVDLTRRDVQARAKEAGQPWEMSKGFDESAPVGLIVPAHAWQPAAEARIELDVNGQSRQSARLGEMIRSVPELLSDLSRTVTLGAGDLVFTGTPAGVASLSRADGVSARIDGLPELAFSIRAD